LPIALEEAAPSPLVQLSIPPLSTTAMTHDPWCVLRACSACRGECWRRSADGSKDDCRLLWMALNRFVGGLFLGDGCLSDVWACGCGCITSGMGPSERKWRLSLSPAGKPRGMRARLSGFRHGPWPMGGLPSAMIME
jgi:hypothetical protein